MNIKIATRGQSADYKESFLPVVLKCLGYNVKWTSWGESDLGIYGPFYREKNSFRWLPRKYRSKARACLKEKDPSVTLFHTAENVRHDVIKTDFSISFDLNVEGDHHLRFPLWMEMMDWSHRGIVGNVNPRFGRLIQLADLLKPLGTDFLTRQKRAVLVSSHLRESRFSLLNAVQNYFPVDGIGPYFDRSIVHHNQSHFKKAEVLKDYGFNLCPENSLYPGYVTEKIPECFACGCLPITWVDSNVSVDFNPNALINLAPQAHMGYEEYLKRTLEDTHLKRMSKESLLLIEPQIEPFVEFVRAIAKEAVLN